MLMNTGHHPGRLVHSQYQSEHYCMLYRLHIRLWQCSLNTTVLDTMHTLNSILTFCICISQLLADHSSISVVPGVVTHCPPLVIDAHLHSTLILIGASHQTNISIGADATDIDCNIETQIKSGSSNNNHVHTLASHSSTSTAIRTTDKVAT